MISIVTRLADKHYVWMILLHRFPHGIRGVAAFAYGLSRLPWSTFLALNLVGAALWACVVVGAGYAFGHVSEKVMNEASSTLGVVMLVLFLGLSWVLSKRLERGRRRRVEGHSGPAPPPRKGAHASPDGYAGRGCRLCLFDQIFKQPRLILRLSWRADCALSKERGERSAERRFRRRSRVMARGARTDGAGSPSGAPLRLLLPAWKPACSVSGPRLRARDEIGSSASSSHRDRSVPRAGFRSRPDVRLRDARAGTAPAGVAPTTG